MNNLATIATLQRKLEFLEKESMQGKQTANALRESEEKYRLLVENANDAIFIAQDNLIKFSNPKTQELLGYPFETLSKMPFPDLIYPSDRKMVRERYEKRLEGERLPNTFSFRITDRVGDIKWMELNSILITWEDRPATLNFLRDITEKKELENKLQQAQRMEAVGTLAAGISHDFNNLLMGIQGNATLMLMNLDAKHPYYEKLKVIEAYVRKGAELTKQLMGFTKSGKYAVQPTDMNQLVQKSSQMFGRRKMEITIYTTFEKNIWAVLTDQRQMEQVLIHLYVNASQAMPGGGAIHLKTENIALNYSQVGPYGLKPGNFVKISVKDTSEGMDKETQGRIFDPFFSSIKLGRGTGLGLAAAYGIVRNHSGLIDVHSKLGDGTTFEIYLPSVDKNESEPDDAY